MTRRVDRRTEVEAAVTGPPEAANHPPPVDPLGRRWDRVARRFRRQTEDEEKRTDGNP